MYVKNKTNRDGVAEIMKPHSREFNRFRLYSEITD